MIANHGREIDATALGIMLYADAAVKEGLPIELHTCMFSSQMLVYSLSCIVSIGDS